MKYNLMTKSKTKSNQKPAQKAKPRRSRQRANKVQDGLDGYGLAAARMYADPCGADLVPTVYSGDRGYINRFVANASVAITAGDTSLILLIKPGNQTAFFRADTAPTTPGAIGYDNSIFPGRSFYTSNASKARCAGYCINVRPNSAPNNATGTIYFGNINASAVPNLASITASGLIPLLSESVSCSQALMQPLEVKWSPGGFDDRYNTIGTITDDDSDRNVLCIVVLGLPAASGMQIRQTVITEWSPANALTVTNDATAVKPSVCDKDCILRHLKRKDSAWWWKLGHKVLDVGKSVGMGYYTGGAVGALGAAVRFM